MRPPFAQILLLALLPLPIVAGCNMMPPSTSAEASAPVAAAAAKVTDLPAPASATSIPLPTDSAPALQAQAAPAEAEVVAQASHTVVAGDTLLRIADRYGLGVAEIMAANNLANPNLLYAGQVLILPEAVLDRAPDFRILPDSLLVRSIRADDFDIAAFLARQPGILRDMQVHFMQWRWDGSAREEQLTAAGAIERASREYSVDPRVMIAFLEHFAGLASERDVPLEMQRYPLISRAQSPRLDRVGLYNQLSWLADRLNQGYYDFKYRGVKQLDMPEGGNLFYAEGINAGTAAVQYALAQVRSAEQLERDWSADGIYATFRRLFGDPSADAYETVPANLQQAPLTLPFPKGEVWRFTGGFHGAWGNGSAWAAIDFGPPLASAGGVCYVSEYPTTAVARGVIARMAEGVVVLDLDGDGNEGSGWTILYLHIDQHSALQVGQMVEAGSILGYASCSGGVSTATHLHIARRYNGEWIPADCNRCPEGTSVPAFNMSGWQVVGLGSQLYQGFLVRTADNHSAVAEQGRDTSINEVSW